jgi:hypothetical protein
MTDCCGRRALGATAPCPLEDENHDVANVVQPETTRAVRSHVGRRPRRSAFGAKRPAGVDDVGGEDRGKRRGSLCSGSPAHAQAFKKALELVQMFRVAALRCIISTSAGDGRLG